MARESSSSSAEVATLVSIQEDHVAEPPPSQNHTRDTTTTTRVDSDRPVSPSFEATRKSVEDRDHVRTTAPKRSPKDRFRAAVRKVIFVHRTSSNILARRVGAEQGIDPRRNSTFAAFRNVHQKCVIDVIDYSSIRCSIDRMTNSAFIKFLQDRRASVREPWIKVRWINVGGISWDVICALAIKYDMHPLSVEDILHLGRHSHTLSKADYYPKHLFIRVLCHTLGSADFTSQGSTTAVGSTGFSSSPSFTDIPRSTSPHHFNSDGMADEGVYENFHGHDADPMANELEIARVSSVDPEIGRRTASLLSYRRRRAIAELTLDELKEDRVHVHIEPICIFLFRDGTVISFNAMPNLDLTEPISTRIRHADTSLRRTADPSLLVQSLLDLTVDSALEVVDEYRARLNMIERVILTKSKVETVRSLHILSGDLILHKRTLGPVKSLIHSLRNYDVDRTAACLDVPTSENEKVVGYMSHMAKIYLADVHDHIEYALYSMDMYSAMAENLVNYSFNMASYETNEAMRRLTLCTILFLPLTLLTGYFGMNFENMWSVNHSHTDVIFWIIAIPVMFIITPTFMWPEIVRGYHHIKKMALIRRITKRFKSE